MATRESTSGLGPTTPEDAFRELLALSISERRDAVARDVGHPSPRYERIPPHDLAEALGIPEPRHPGPDWSFTRYAPIVTVEEHAQCNSPASELVYLIEGSVDPERFQRLLKLSESLDEVAAPSFSFLTKKERAALEQTIAERQLEANESNGLSCIAHCSVECSSGEELAFEGDIEHDGACIHLRTPYDKRANRFRDLTRCLTTCW